MSLKRHSVTVSEPSEEQIQIAAYYLWLESGRAHGRDVEHWFAAREMLRHQHREAPGTRGKKRQATPLVPPPAPANPKNN